MIRGLLAALLDGAAWAVLAAVTGYEIGYAAVGVGAWVSLAMGRATPRRDHAAAGVAVALALTGLVTARVVIAEFVLPQAMTREILADPELITEAAIIELTWTARLSPELQEKLAAIPYDASLPDDLYRALQSEATDYIEGMGDDERHRIAEQFMRVAAVNLGMTGLIREQLSLFDLLWVFLAVSTAWKMITG